MDAASFEALEARLSALEALVGEQQVVSANFEAALVASGDTTWTIICAALVFFMQAGFALVESGSCRWQSTQSILMKNMMDAVVGTLGWFLVGFGLAFGPSDTNEGHFGTLGFLGDVFPVFGNWNGYHFQWSFAACTATIVSGGVAERIPMQGYICFTVWMTSVIYPIVVCWCWGPNGWLGGNGYSDFAGSGVVHLCGGVAALCGEIVIGARVGRFGSDKWRFNPHSIPNVVLGTMMLWFGWYGFNCGSTAAMSSMGDAEASGRAAVTTSCAGAAGALSTFLYTTYMRGQYDLASCCNGVLGGLVGVTAGCANVNIQSSILIGALAGLIMLAATEAMDRIQIDDPVGAFPVHGVCGAWGVLCVSFFDDAGEVPLDYQIIGILAIAGWTAVNSLCVFGCLRLAGFGVTSARDQRRGIDAKYKADAYMSATGVMRYRAFLSHAKGTHGTFARWLHVDLGKLVEGKSRIFLDSDNLVNLDSLMLTVREKIDVLIVVASAELWWRPWCAGEIAQAVMAQVPIVVISPGKDLFDLDKLQEDLPDKYAEQEDEMSSLLEPYGIFYDDIERAYGQIASSAEHVLFQWQDPAKIHDSFTELAAKAELVSGGVAGAAASVLNVMGDACAPVVKKLMPGTHGTADHLDRPVVLLADDGDIEAVSTAMVMANGLRETAPNAEFVVSGEVSKDVIMDAIDRGAHCVLILSEKVTHSVMVSRALIAIGESDMPRICVPIVADKLGFVFPDDPQFDQIIVEITEALDRTGGAGKDTKSAVKTLVAFYLFAFKLIALPLSNHASWRTIEQQLRAVYDRVNPVDKHDDTSLWKGPNDALMAVAVRRVNRAPATSAAKPAEQAAAATAEADKAKDATMSAAHRGSTKAGGQNRLSD